MQKFLIACILLSVQYSCQSQDKPHKKMENKKEKPAIYKTDEEWKKQLTPLQFHITREAGTEYPHTGEYNNHFEQGYYTCVCCKAVLFKSNSKFKSSCGWPSFYDKSKENNIIEIIDKSHGMIRTEVRCAKCNAHLGHVFNDGPEPTGLRYCINSAALEFHPISE